MTIGSGTSFWGDRGFTADVTFRNSTTGSLGNVDLAYDTVAGTTGIFNVESGATVTTGRLRVASLGGTTTSGTITVDGAGSSLTQSGASPLTVGHASTGTATINVTNGGTFSTGTGSATLNPTGTILVDGGTFNFNGPIVDNGLTLNFLAGTINVFGDFTIGAGGLIDGDIYLASNDQFGVGGTTTIDALRTLSLTGGTLTTGELVVDGTFVFQTGTLSITGPGGLTLGAAGPLGSVLTVNSTGTINVASTLTVDAGSMFTVAGGSLAIDGATSNSGTVTILNTTVDFTDGLTNNNADLVLIDAIFNGDITNPAGSALTVVGNVTHNGALSGAGGIFGPGTLTINGAHNPGDSSAEVPIEGNLVYGNGNTLTIELGGLLLGEFDRLVIAGDATLDGNLVIDLINGFTPSFGNEFEILDIAGTLSGQFLGLDEGALVDNFGGMDLFITYTAGDGNNLALFTIPEPAALPGDFDGDNDVDGVDFGLWQSGYPTASGASLGDGDADGDGDVDGVDFGIWQENYPTNLGGAAAVPEPATLGLLLLGGLALLRRRK